MTGKAAAFIGILLGMALALPTEGAQGSSKILEVRHWTAPDHTRVVIDIDQPPAYEVPASADPLTLRVHLPHSELSKGRRVVSINDQVIRQMVIEPRQKKGVDVILFLIKPARWNIFPLKPYLDKPHRVVIDVFRPDLEAKEKAKRQVTQELKAKQKRIVVIDPGHGGEDPGAIGPRGAQEKDIVLAIAKSLQKELEQDQGLRAFLTRQGDYFISLDERSKIAREYGADLFISLHTNGSRSRKIRGTSVYCLSLRGASDQAAQLLAQKENASDMVGGASLPRERADLNSILQDLELTHTINESLHLGGMALRELRRVNQIQFPQPKQAEFRVLKNSGFPAILVETAYITNPIEEKHLQRKNFQSEMARAISEAVRKFIPHLASRERGMPMKEGKGDWEPTGRERFPKG